MDLQRQHEERNRLANMMKKISEDIKEYKLPTPVRVKAQMKKLKKSDREIEARLLEMRFNEMSSNFKSYSRERRHDIFFSKTNPPPVGQYRPKEDYIQSQSPRPKMPKQHINEELATSRKY